MARTRTVLALACTGVAVLVAVGLAAGVLERSIVPEEPGDWLAAGPAATVCIRPGQRLQYTVGLQGAPLGEVTVTGGSPANGGRSPVVNYRLRTLPALHWAWEFEATGTTVLDPETLLPFRVETTTRDKDGTTVTTSLFRPKAGEVWIAEQEPDEDEPDEDLVTAERAADPVAALLLLGAAEAGGQLTVLKGDDAYRVRAEPGDLETLKLPAGEFAARRWTVTVREWDEDEGPAPSEHVLRVWMDAATGVPLQLEADLLVGRLAARLVSLSESDEG
ncbi:MAG: DUF3108 domain-containing protein [Candidatus Brocadiia bacterium]